MDNLGIFRLLSQCILISSPHFVSSDIGFPKYGLVFTQHVVTENKFGENVFDDQLKNTERHFSFYYIAIKRNLGKFEKYMFAIL